jgi:hypothetical protein
MRAVEHNCSHGASPRTRSTVYASQRSFRARHPGRQVVLLEGWLVLDDDPYGSVATEHPYRGDLTSSSGVLPDQEARKQAQHTAPGNALGHGEDAEKALGRDVSRESFGRSANYHATF